MLVVLAPENAFAFLGVADTGDGILSGILAENVKQTADSLKQLQQLRQVIATTRENYDFLRSTYALASDVLSTNPDKFLKESMTAFVSSEPAFSQASSLANDISRQGLRGGHPNWWAIQRRIDIFREDHDADACGCDTSGRPSAANATNIHCAYVCEAALARGYPLLKCSGDQCSTIPTPYNDDAAQRLSAGIDNSLTDPAKRDEILSAPPVASSSSAVVFNELISRDQSVASDLLRERALAAKASGYASDNWQKSQRSSVNAGSADVLTAQNTSLAAEQLAAMRDYQARQLALTETQVSDAAKARAQETADIEIHALHVADLVHMSIYQGLTSQDKEQPVASTSQTSWGL